MLGVVAPLTAQYAYFYTGGARGAYLNEITLAHEKDGQKVNYNMAYDWIRLDLGKGTHQVVAKSTKLANPLTVRVDLSGRPVAFYMIKLGKAAWSVEEVAREKAHSSAVYDYQTIEQEAKKASRIAAHPKTAWTEAKLKTYFGKEREAIEGIYKLTDRYGNSPEYTLGLVKNGDAFDLVYLAGGTGTVWKPGDLKGKIKKTGKAGIYHVDWYMGDKSLEKDRYTEYGKGAFTIKVTDRIYAYYVKTYPVHDSK